MRGPHVSVAGIVDMGAGFRRGAFFAVVVVFLFLSCRLVDGVADCVTVAGAQFFGLPGPPSEVRKLPREDIAVLVADAAPEITKAQAAVVGIT